ncbi:MAG: hypothetical protein WC782_16250 [Methylococcaceae bacterium]|jgi:hypothetical protein
MTVEQLIEALQTMPSQAVVLFEGDNGYSLVAGVNLEKNDDGHPDEVILYPDMNE